MEKSGQRYWNSRYQSKETGWDIGYPSTPLARYIDQLTSLSLSILIPGCGNAYEAQYLLEKGFTSVTLIDIAPEVTRAISEKLRNYIQSGQLKVITGDFFELRGQFDLILEQTFLSALPPSLRSNYVQKMQELLKPNGKLVGVIFNTIFDKEGPPFGGTMEEYRRMFEKSFQIRTLEPCYNSIEQRAGTEAFIHLVKE